jgi:anti-sigma factor RsiW
MSQETHRHDAKDPDCMRVFASLSEYLDGELSREDCRRIEAHMSGCGPCIEFLESLKQSIVASRRVPAPEPPPSMPAELREKLMSAWRSALERRGEETAGRGQV